MGQESYDNVFSGIAALRDFPTQILPLNIPDQMHAKFQWNS